MLITLFIVLFTFLVVCAYTDIAGGKIYNWATYPAIGAGLALNLLIGGISGEHGGEAAQNYNLINSILGCLLGFLVLGILYAAGGIGLGDVKLAGAIGALIGWYYLFYTLFFSSLVGGIMAFALAIWRGQFLATMKGSLAFLFTLRAPKIDPEQKPLTIPFGFALVMGTYWCWFMFLDDTNFFPVLSGSSS
jgi:prepilin peptidase CpaA